MARTATYSPWLSTLGWCACAASIAFASAVSDAADSAHAGSVSRGEQLAKLICSACHVVASDQEFQPLLRQPAPPFAEIANRPGTNEKSLRHFITTTHWDERTVPMTMPNPELTDEQTVAVSRYILSLRGRAH